MPLDFDAFLANAPSFGLARFVPGLSALLEDPQRTWHGKQAEWDQALAALPPHVTTALTPGPVINIGAPGEVTPDVLNGPLKSLLPWRKGPWSFFGLTVDAEWRSDFKWARLQPHLSPLSGKHVLDVGCGNGYYLFRMLAEGAKFALGVDPNLLYLYQFQAAKHFVPSVPLFVLPLKSEDLPPFGLFDTVFSMGVLYHRRTPDDHLEELMGFLKPGGELVLETLVVPGDARTVLHPPERYAQMANVWSIPSTNALETWLWRSGFEHVRTVDVTRTTTAEQRSTDWMTFQSLADFLNPANADLTVEGYPAPTRAIVVARKPE